MAEVKVNPALCVGCGSCMGVCPAMAINFDENGKAKIDPTKCMQCHTCASVCPMAAIATE